MAAAWAAAASEYRWAAAAGSASAPIIVLGLVGWAFGIDPRILIGGAEILTGGQQSPSYQIRSPVGAAKSAARRRTRWAA